MKRASHCARAPSRKPAFNVRRRFCGRSPINLHKIQFAVRSAYCREWRGCWRRRCRFKDAIGTVFKTRDEKRPSLAREANHSSLAVLLSSLLSDFVVLSRRRRRRWSNLHEIRFTFDVCRNAQEALLINISNSATGMQSATRKADISQNFFALWSYLCGCIYRWNICLIKFDLLIINNVSVSFTLYHYLSYNKII